MIRISMIDRDYVRNVLHEFYRKQSEGTGKLLIKQIEKRLGLEK